MHKTKEKVKREQRWITKIAIPYQDQIKHWNLSED